MKIFTYLYDLFFGNETTVSTRKAPDFYQFNDEELSYLLSRKQDWYADNKGKKREDHMSIHELVDSINEELGRNKSYSAYRRIWAELEKDKSIDGTTDIEHIGDVDACVISQP